MNGNLLAGLIIGLIIGTCVFTFLSLGIFLKDTIMFIQYPDGSYIKGIRKKQYVNQETKGTHHFLVTDATDKSLIGKRVAIPINSVKYFIIEGK